MKKRSLLLFGIALLFAVALPLHGQDGGIGTSGCDDSPENATAILAVVGSVGAFLASARARYKARRGTSE